MGKYRVVTIDPEILNDWTCREFLQDPKIASKLMYIVFDESPDCLSQRWGHTFRSEYFYVGNLRYVFPHDTIPFYVASTALPPHSLADVAHTLRLRPGKTESVFCSNDRPNIHIVVREIKYPVSSYHDLAFLVPDGFHTGSPRFPKFLIFLDSTTATEDAVRYLQKRLPIELRRKILWFHSGMSSAFLEEELEHFRSGEVWGMAVTSAFIEVSIKLMYLHCTYSFVF